MAVKWAGTRPGHRALDICCGSGDLAFILQQAAGPTGRVTGLDFAQDMLDDAAVRAAGVPRPSGAAMNPIQCAPALHPSPPLMTPRFATNQASQRQERLEPGHAGRAL